MEMEENELKKLLRTVLSTIDTIDEAVELYDKDSPGTAMSFLGAQAENIARNLYELENNNKDIKKLLDEMEETEEDEETLDKIVRGEEDVEELF